MLLMKDLFSPGSFVTVAGGVLSVVGVIAYLNGNANLSLPTFFYGVPILLGGLALKSSELEPAKRVVQASVMQDARKGAPPELIKLVNDVTRWRYGQKAHLESSLEVLNLWDEENPPQLREVEELDTPNGYGVRLRFDLAGVPLERWHERKDRLGRFFAKGLVAELESASPEQVDLTLQPAQTSSSKTGQHGES